MTDIEKERGAFEAWAAGEGFATALKADYANSTHGGEYDTYDTSCAWDAWLARARSERVVSVVELEALAKEWVREGDGYARNTEDGRKALYGCAFDLRALIAKAEVSNG